MPCRCEKGGTSSGGYVYFFYSLEMTDKCEGSAVDSCGGREGIPGEQRPQNIRSTHLRNLCVVTPITCSPPAKTRGKFALVKFWACTLRCVHVGLQRNTRKLKNVQLSLPSLWLPMHWVSPWMTETFTCCCFSLLSVCRAYNAGLVLQQLEAQKCISWDIWGTVQVGFLKTGWDWGV